MWDTCLYCARDYWRSGLYWLLCWYMVIRGIVVCNGLWSSTF